MRFKEGDLLFYPGYGIVQIHRVEEKEIAGTKVLTYFAKLWQKNTEFIIPSTSINKIGLRPLIEAQRVPEIYALLKTPIKVLSNGVWNRRYKEYTDRFKKGDIFDLARLLRELVEISKTKPLSFGEKKLFDQAKDLLVKEIALAQNRKEDEVEAEIMSCLAL